MNDYMQFLICYDTPDNRRRRKIIQVIEESTERIQWSVFEGWMTSRQADQLTQRLHQVIDPEFDHVRVYRLCRYCQQEVRVLGLGERTTLVKYWII